jgi:hypothetical protein
MYICSRGSRPLFMTRVQAAAELRPSAAVQLARSCVIPAKAGVAKPSATKTAATM